MELKFLFCLVVVVFLSVALCESTYLGLTKKERQLTLSSSKKLKTLIIGPGRSLCGFLRLLVDYP